MASQSYIEAIKSHFDEKWNPFPLFFFGIFFSFMSFFSNFQYFHITSAVLPQYFRCNSCTFAVLSVLPCYFQYFRVTSSTSAVLSVLPWYFLYFCSTCSTYELIPRYFRYFLSISVLPQYFRTSSVFPQYFHDTSGTFTVLLVLPQWTRLLCFRFWQSSFIKFFDGSLQYEFIQTFFNCQKIW